MTTIDRLVGAGVERIDGPAKVRGTAPYAYEHDPGEPPAHVAVVQSTVNRGRITRLDPSRAEAMPGVLAVLTPANAPRLASTGQPQGPPDDPYRGQSVDLGSDLPVLQSLDVHYQGQIVAAVVAETSEIAKAAVGAVAVAYDAEPPDVVLTPDRPDLYAPEQVNAGFATDSVIGDVDGALAAAPVSIDVTYETPTQHNNPIEPHTTIARWDGDSLTLWDANQGPHNIVADLTRAFALEPARLRIISPYVGGAFGSKAFTHPNQILAAMAARMVGRAVVFELSRQQMFSLAGHRTPTIQRCGWAPPPTGGSRPSATRSSSTPHGSTRSPSRPPRPPASCTPPRTGGRRTGWPGSTSRRRRSCGHRGRPRACTRSSRRWTSSPPPSAWIRSSCGSARSPSGIPNGASPGPVATSWSVCVRAPSGSAGPAATRDPACGPTADG